MSRIGSLCSGYGGLDHAVQAVYGGELAWVSDIDKGACKILAHRYPDVPNIGDMTAVDWAGVEQVEVICGGTPCQDLSHAGKRAGMSQGTRSNLWVAMREAVATIRPRLVVWENVGGAYSARADSEMERDPRLLGVRPDGPVLRALGRVLGDLASLGYDASWHGLRASDVGAPHGRFRVFVVARDAAVCGRDGSQPTHRSGERPRATGGSDLLPTPRATRGDSSTETVSLLGTPTARNAPRSKRFADGLLPTPDANMGNGGRTRSREALERGDHQANLNDLPRLGQWGDYAAAIARWGAVLGREAPAPTMTSTKGNPQLSPAFVEWMMGLPAGWVTDAPGITRNEALRALGNGVVPQQAEAALRTMLAWDAAA